MSWGWPILCALLVLAPVPAGAAELLLVAGRAGTTPRDRSLNVRLGQAVQVHVVVRTRQGKRTRYYSDAPGLVLRGRRIRRRQLRPLSQLGVNDICWYRVEPRPHHTFTPPPNKGNPAYSNAILFGRHHGKWLGHDEIEYHETAIAGAHGPSLTVTRTRPTHPRVDVNGGLGTMRYRATLRLADGTLLASPGSESRNRGGISARVLRVTFRGGDGLPGYLRGYFNVPNVFGSAGSGRSHQAELYQGADCADVIIGAARRAGARIPYTSVSGLVRHLRPLTGVLLMTRESITATTGERKGQPVELRFGKQVQPGDIMLINYQGFNGSPRRWDHIAVIDRDLGVRGQLDPRDPVLHMGYLFGLVDEPMLTQAPAQIQLLRLKPRLLRAIKRQQRRTR
jgi:hypothetical protein